MSYNCIEFHISVGSSFIAKTASFKAWSMMRLTTLWTWCYVSLCCKWRVAIMVILGICSMEVRESAQNSCLYVRLSFLTLQTCKIFSLIWIVWHCMIWRPLMIFGIFGLFITTMKQYFLKSNGGKLDCSLDVVYWMTVGLHFTLQASECGI